MSYRDQLRPASFRGVPFFVEAAGGTFGRRTVTHEYPQRDKPFSEDLGRAARKITITAFVIEPDYMTKRDRLLEALEQSGPGTLVHPFLGTMSVTAEPANLNENKQDGGVARFTLSFTESGDITFPTTERSTNESVNLRANAANLSLQQDFTNQFTVANQPDFVTDEAVTVLGQGLTSIRQSLGVQ